MTLLLVNVEAATFTGNTIKGGGMGGGGSGRGGGVAYNALSLSNSEIFYFQLMFSLLCQLY